MEAAMRKLGLSARAYMLILKVARTMEDLYETDQKSEAIQCRSLDRRVENRIS